jgi:3-phytase
MKYKTLPSFVAFLVLSLVFAATVTSVGQEKARPSPSSPGKNAPPGVAIAVGNTTDSNGNPIESVIASVETAPVPNGGDAADDPAIWVNPADPSKSTVIGTDKQGGLAVYDLAGKQLQYLKIGKVDNVDLRQGFKLGGQAVALVTAGSRTDNSIAIYRVNEKTRLLEDVAARVITTLPVYGSCMYRSPKTEKFYYFVTSKSGDIEQWELFDNGQGKIDGKKVRAFKVGTVIEGCVADDDLGHLYISEEAVGIWKYGAEPGAGTTRTQVDKTGQGGHLVPDVEGLAIAYGPTGTGYLMASSQGNHSYVVYRREGDNAFVKTFRVSAGDGIDGTEDTDGVDVTMTPLGSTFPHGVFVAQDGTNDNANQNFKLVPLERILGSTSTQKERPVGQ